MVVRVVGCFGLTVSDYVRDSSVSHVKQIVQANVQTNVQANGQIGLIRRSLEPVHHICTHREVGHRATFKLERGGV